MLRGITPQCQFLMPQENVLSEAGQILIDSGQIFQYGNSVVMEIAENGTRTIRPLVTDHKAEPVAASLLANLLICQLRGTDPATPPVEFPPPPRFVELLLNHEPTQQRLPKIELYATRPVFDEEFTFRGPGWHEDVHYLVHGPDVEPCVPDHVPTAECVRDHLPPRLRELLRDFCFRDAADVVNAVAVLLTGLLVSLFVRCGKPLVLLDGNQPGIGKTLLARVFGVIFDGHDPEAIHFTTDDEELAKRICANLRGKPTSVVLIDNAKIRAGGEVSSPVLEANSMAPQVSLRILGHSANYSRPNDLLWFVTMNLTKTSPDLVSRGLPIRFHFEGNPGQRDFCGRDPVEYADQHRQEILGELAGMVVFWNQHGRPLGTERHRLTRWATVIGGILNINGLEGFLGNLDDAANAFNSDLDILTALAETAAGLSRDGFVQFVDQPPRDGEALGSRESAGRLAGDWERVFRQADAFTDELGSGRSQRARATRIGSFFGQHRDREILIESNTLVGTARLRVVEGRSRRRLYYFEIRTEAVDGNDATPPPTELADGLGDTTRTGSVAPTSHGDDPQDTGDSAQASGGNQEDW